ncbi:MAG: hypothetical protein ACD_75C02293G0001 [uncultured bacterium]|nr:MAG: hypothetical protein ACD_75C02293G0001 [uncultured bacterium]
MDGETDTRRLQGEIVDRQGFAMTFEAAADTVDDNQLAAVAGEQLQSIKGKPVDHQGQRQENFGQLHRSTGGCLFFFLLLLLLLSILLQGNLHAACGKACDMKLPAAQPGRVPAPFQFTNLHLDLGRGNFDPRHGPIAEQPAAHPTDGQHVAAEAPHALLHEIQPDFRTEQQTEADQTEQAAGNEQSAEIFHLHLHHRSPPTVKWTRKGVSSSVMAEATSNLIWPKGRRKRIPPPTP